MMSELQTYQAYLLRLQRDLDEPHWRCRLENVATGEIHHFGGEREMFAYLWHVINTNQISTEEATDKK